jgi:hypothetical protein
MVGFVRGGAEEVIITFDEEIDLLGAGGAILEDWQLIEVDIWLALSVLGHLNIERELKGRHITEVVLQLEHCLVKLELLFSYRAVEDICQLLIAVDYISTV